MANTAQTVLDFLATYTCKATTSDEYLLAFSLGHAAILTLIDNITPDWYTNENEKLKNIFSTDLRKLDDHNVNYEVINKMYFLPFASDVDSLTLFKYGRINVTGRIESPESFLNLTKACKIKFGKEAKIDFKCKEGFNDFLKFANLAELDINFSTSFN
jgi:hypothetical protein